MIPSRSQVSRENLIFVLLTIAVFLVINLSNAFQAGFFSAVIFFFLGFAYKYRQKALRTFLIYLPFSGTVSYWIGHFSYQLSVISYQYLRLKPEA
ncbi:MAG: hypothetical protein F6K23_34020 [Okeania sp. SIO2C9]|uniref:hypothetical protein n=1 Tax=Okeania sp. SIO2C9 TaxID=2607791 RepID=UPI0013BF161A|nr:hypothetical protein [Okeania sp. SIO2C9]NEQ77595.1 hypothetical protein [Okeania sp. SIO2C9]